MNTSYAFDKPIISTALVNGPLLTLSNKYVRVYRDVDNPRWKGSIMKSVSKEVRQWKSIKRKRVAGWYRPELGATCIGAIQEKRINRAGGKDYYIILLHAPCHAIDSEGVEAELEPGELIGVGESAALRDLSDHIGAVVRIVPKGKIAIGDGRSFWDYDVDVAE